MKKILLFSAAVLFAAVTMAQTVCSSTLRMRYCFTTTINQDTTVGCNLPYMWHGKALSQTDIYKDTVKTGECDSIFIMNFTATDFTTKDTLAQVAVCGSDPYVWPGSGVYADSTIKKAGFYTRTFTSVKGCDSLVTLPAVAKACKPEGAIEGLFSVASGKKVYFSKGNLLFQYMQYDGQGGSTAFKHATQDNAKVDGRFSFMEHQYDMTGHDDVFYEENRINYYDYQNILRTSNELADCMCSPVSCLRYGSSGYGDSSTPMWYPSEKDKVDNLPSTDIAGTNYDWGVYNAIENGGNTPGMWRTLTKDEWDYLLFERNNGNQGLNYATIKYYDEDATYALLIFPDGWTGEYAIKPSSSGYDLTELQTMLTETKAALLPASIYRHNSGCYDEYIYYYTSSADTDNSAAWVLKMNVNYSNPTYYGLSFYSLPIAGYAAQIRLVADAE